MHSPLGAQSNRVITIMFHTLVVESIVPLYIYEVPGSEKNQQNKSVH